MTRLAYLRILFLAGVLMPGWLVAQSQAADSLEQVFYQHNKDSVGIEAALALCDEWSFLQTDTAWEWARRAYALAEELQSPALTARSLYQLGAAAYDKRELQQAMAYFLQALERFEELGDDRQRMDTRLEIGLIYQDMGEYGQARKYLDAFYQFYARKGAAEAPNIIFALNQFVVLFEQMQEVDSMLHYARATLEAAEQYGQDKYLANIHNNLASVYLYAKDYPSAQYHFQQAERIGFGPNKVGRYYNFYALADMKRALGEPDSSAYYAKRALTVAQSFGDLEKESNIHLFLSGLYQENGYFEQAFSQLDTFTKLKDSLTALRHQRDLSELSVRYQTQEKEARIAQQQLELEQEANRRNRLLFGGLLGFLLLGGAFFFWRKRKQEQARQTALELKFQQAEANRLRELSELKSNFFANISHEFRTPLTLLLGPLRDMETGQRQAEPNALARMRRQGERLLNLADQMLDLSKLESGAMPERLEQYDLTRMTALTAAAFESMAEQKRIHLHTDLPEEAAPVILDADKIEKVLNNLLGNALKFTPDSGQVSLRLRMKPNGDQYMARIEVQDSGPGIPPEQLPHIFERFYQGQPEGRQEGAGIGLALTRELVHFMGGDIHVESKVGHGTRFVLSIPFQKAPAPTAAIQATPVRPDNGQPLVLITEDNPELRQYICEQLQEQYQIIEAAEGQTGLQMAQEQLPDLILSDVRMPGMDGLDFCRAIKTDERSSHIPVILLTALADQEDVRTGLLTGADAYLTKPFDAEELRIRVGQLIQQRRQLREKFARSLKDSPAPVEAENTADAVFLRKVEQAVMSQLDEEDFSIEALGRAVGMSRSQLHRKIKALTDQSPSVFVRTLRLREAYRLLQAKAGNVSEVAHQVGMPNLAHFSRSFKDLFGHPPSQIS